MALFQLQRIKSVVKDEKMIMNGEQVRIWQEAVVA
jgi:hypothetical protein